MEQRPYDITVLGLCETKWTQSGQVKLNTGKMVLYSCQNEWHSCCYKRSRTVSSAGRKQDQRSFVLLQEVQNALVSWEGAGPTIIRAVTRGPERSRQLGGSRTNDHSCCYKRSRTLSSAGREQDQRSFVLLQEVQNSLVSWEEAGPTIIRAVTRGPERSRQLGGSRTNDHSCCYKRSRTLSSAGRKQDQRSFVLLQEVQNGLVSWEETGPTIIYALFTTKMNRSG